MTIQNNSHNLKASPVPGNVQTLPISSNARLSTFPAEFSCPSCRSPLERVAADAYRCPADGLEFERIAGIWRFLPPTRVAHFAQFLQDYETVRRSEGRSSSDSIFYRLLPFEDRTGRFAGDWTIRATSFQALVEHVLQPLETRHVRPLRVLDIGAGNGWLAYRLALRGHHVAAVDLSLSAADGLGTHVHYDAEFTPVQAEFDRLPFGERQVDLVIFNASLHYSADLLTTLNEALRVLNRDGRIVVMDSPVYHDRASGLAMVREREQAFTKRFGFPSNAVPMENFLTYQRLGDLAASTGLGWHMIRPRYGIRWSMRRWRARLRRSREPASFILLVGRRHAQTLRQIPLRRLWRGLLTAGIPLKRFRLRRPVLEWVGGRPLLVLPQVFNPKVMRSGEFLARVVDEQHLPAKSVVLDMGTGSGIGAISAARCAKCVVAVDINPEAVRCARLNAMLNRVEERIDARQGDLFEAVPGEQFELVLFNPPYYRGEPRNLLDRAWRSTNVIERFARELPAHLSPGGSALVVLSTDGMPDKALASFREAGFVMEVVDRRDCINEVLTVYRLINEGRVPRDHSI